MRAFALRNDLARFRPPKPPPRMTMWGLFLLIGFTAAGSLAGAAGDGAVSVADMRRNYTHRTRNGKRHRMVLRTAGAALGGKFQSSFPNTSLSLVREQLK